MDEHDDRSCNETAGIEAEYGCLELEASLAQQRPAEGTRSGGDVGVASRSSSGSCGFDEARFIRVSDAETLAMATALDAQLAKLSLAKPETTTLRAEAWINALIGAGCESFTKELITANVVPLYVQTEGTARQKVVEQIEMLIHGERGSRMGVFGSVSYNPSFTQSKTYADRKAQGVVDIVEAAACGFVKNTGFSQVLMGGAWDGAQGTFAQIVDEGAKGRPQCQKEIIHVLPILEEALDDVQDILWEKPEALADQEWKDKLGSDISEIRHEILTRSRRSPWHIIFAGKDWTERNLILSQLVSTACVVAGGPGTVNGTTHVVVVPLNDPDVLNVVLGCPRAQAGVALIAAATHVCTEVVGARLNDTGLIPLYCTGGAVQGHDFTSMFEGTNPGRPMLPHLQGIENLACPEGVNEADWRTMCGQDGTVVFEVYLRATHAVTASISPTIASFPKNIWKLGPTLESRVRALHAPRTCKDTSTAEVAAVAALDAPVQSGAGHDEASSSTAASPASTPTPPDQDINVSEQIDKEAHETLNELEVLDGQVSPGARRTKEAVPKEREEKEQYAKHAYLNKANSASDARVHAGHTLYHVRSRRQQMASERSASCKSVAKLPGRRPHYMDRLHKAKAERNAAVEAAAKTKAKVEQDALAEAAAKAKEERDAAMEAAVKARVQAEEDAAAKAQLKVEKDASRVAKARAEARAEQEAAMKAATTAKIKVERAAHLYDSLVHKSPFEQHTFSDKTVEQDCGTDSNTLDSVYAPAAASRSSYHGRSRPRRSGDCVPIVDQVARTFSGAPLAGTTPSSVAQDRTTSLMGAASMSSTPPRNVNGPASVTDAAAHVQADPEHDAAVKRSGAHHLRNLRDGKRAYRRVLERAPDHAYWERYRETLGGHGALLDFDSKTGSAPDNSLAEDVVASSRVTLPPARASDGVAATVLTDRVVFTTRQSATHWKPSRRGEQPPAPTYSVMEQQYGAAKPSAITRGTDSVHITTLSPVSHSVLESHRAAQRRAPAPRNILGIQQSLSSTRSSAHLHGGDHLRSSSVPTNNSMVLSLSPQRTGSGATHSPLTGSTRYMKPREAYAASRRF